MKPLVRAENLTKHFTVSQSGFFSGKKRTVHAVDEVSIEIGEGETFSLVGETGSGKTTVAKMVARLIEPTDGHIYFRDSDIYRATGEELKKIRLGIQMIFQDPFASLNPRKTLADIITLPLLSNHLIEKRQKEEAASALLAKVGLVPQEQFLHKHPHELSGGQRQRVGIARALAPNPQFLIADEPVSALDASIKSQILNLLDELKKDLSLTCFVISHDLATVRYMSTNVAVMHLGRLVELSGSEEFFKHPEHPYSQALLAATPEIGEKKQSNLGLKGEMPSPIDLPSGCRFHTRCPFAKQKCIDEEPTLREVRSGHYVACFFPASERAS
jgi:peptide/nickel transport system ATP-binding protein